MHPLDLKIPPPLVLLACALGLYATDAFTPFWSYYAGPDPRFITAAVFLALAGIGVAVAGVVQFRFEHTTISPLRPERSASLVNYGVYAHTRNPMYLGMALLLCAYGVFLKHPAGVAWVLIFVVYITSYQIIPEEHALGANFGDAYHEYTRKVRRWI